MVLLPNLDMDPTLEAMHAAVEREREKEPKRSYLGASSLGHECERNVWYQYNGYPAEPMNHKGYYAVEDGHRSEDLIASRLRMVPGVELVTQDEAGNQFGFTKFDGKFKGHIDGFIRGLLQAPKTPHIWENKAINEKKFADFQKLKQKFGEKNALKEWDFTFYVQAQIYMGEFGLERHYLTACTPGGRAVDSCRTEFNKGQYDSFISKAQRILGAREAPERVSTRKELLVCKWCKFNDECWKEKA